MKLTPSHRLYGLGAVMFVALVVSTRLPGGVGAPLYLIALAVAGIAYLFALREFSSRRNSPAASSSSGWCWPLCGIFHFC